MKSSWLRAFDTPLGLAGAAALVSAVVLGLTAPGLPLVWDEGEYLWRSDLVVEWFRLLGRIGTSSGGRNAFSPAVIHEYWRFDTWVEGHPAWSAVPLAAATALFKGVLHPLTAARLGTIAVFSAACAAVAFRLRQSQGAAAALVAVTSLLTLPRLFAEAHFATLDGQLTAWWLLLWAVSASPHPGLRTALGTGVLAGLTSATKFTGWLAWPPLIAARLFSADRKGRIGVLVIVPVGLLTFLAVNPPLWRHPVDDGLVHVGLNLHRSLNVPITFLGTTYDLHRPLPWYNTLAWLMMVTPVPILLLGAIGVADAAQRRGSIAVVRCFTGRR